MSFPPVQSVEDARVQIEDLLSSLGEEESPGFSRFCIDKDTARVTRVERRPGPGGKGYESTVVCTMLVTAKMANQLGNMHGGCAATIIDNLSSLNLYLHTSGVMGEPWSMLGVSQNITVVYFSPCPVDSWIEVETVTQAVGRSVSVTQTTIWLLDGEGGQRVRKTAQGSHTKIDNSSQAKL